MTILNTVPCTVYCWGWTSLSTIAISIIIFFTVLGCFFFFQKSSAEIGTFFLAVALAVGILALPLSGINGKIDEEYIIYKVIIDDSISMKEFTEKYKILTRDGEIWEIREWNSIEGGRPAREDFRLEIIE